MGYILRKWWNNIRWYYHNWWARYYCHHIRHNRVKFEKHMAAMRRLTLELSTMMNRTEKQI